MSTAPNLYFNSRSLSPLSNDQLRAKAPAVFAENPHQKTSDNYLFLPTINLIEGLRKVGWEAVAAKQSGNRKSSPEAKETNKHALFFARSEMLQRGANYGDSLPLVKLENAHNGSSAFGLSTGFFRILCSNGLTVPDSIYSAPRVRHTLNMIEEAQNATLTVLRDFPRLLEMRDKLASITLSHEEKMLLGDAAADIFFTPEERQRVNKAWHDSKRGTYVRGAYKLAPIETQLVQPQHYDRNKNDLWTVSNVIQENLIKGGRINLVTETGDVRANRVVTAIDRDNDIHDKLFRLTQKFAELKGVSIGLTKTA